MPAECGDGGAERHAEISETVMPPVTSAIARARRSGGTKATATAFAAGMNTPEASAMTMRASISQVKSLVKAATRLASVKTVSEPTSTSLRSRLPNSVESTGEPMA